MIYSLEVAINPTHHKKKKKRNPFLTKNKKILRGWKYMFCECVWWGCARILAPCELGNKNGWARLRYPCFGKHRQLILE